METIQASLSNLSILRPAKREAGNFQRDQTKNLAGDLIFLYSLKRSFSFISTRSSHGLHLMNGMVGGFIGRYSERGRFCKASYFGWSVVDFRLSEEQEMIREMAREFCDQEVIPYAEEWDREGTYPLKAISKAHDLGLLNVTIPNEYGGAGMSSIDEMIICEEMSRGDPGFGTASYHTTLASFPILTGGTEEQKNLKLAPAEKPSSEQDELPIEQAPSLREDDKRQSGRPANEEGR